MHSAFAVKSLYKNNDSYVAARREFRKKFGIHRNSKVPSAHAIMTRVNNSEETGSTVNTLRTGLLNCLNARSRGLTFRHRASCI